VSSRPCVGPDRHCVRALAPGTLGGALDVAEFQKLYAEHHAWVWRLLGRFGVPDALVDDAVQDVFVVVHRRFDDYDARTPVKSWIAGIARKVAALHARTEGRARRRAEVYQQPVDGPTPDDRVTLRQAAELVDGILGTLPGEQREVFVLAELEGWTAPEIAAAMQIKVGTVHSRLHVARGRFAEAVAALHASGRRHAP
jgi:RNA polymerase sigma-70 factor (ECF subfamily)